MSEAYVPFTSSRSQYSRPATVATAATSKADDMKTSPASPLSPPTPEVRDRAADVRAVATLKRARSADIDLAVVGTELAIRAPAGAQPSLLDALRANRADIIALLTPGPGGMTGEDWIVLFEERAAIIEFEGGLSRLEAERRAFDDTLTVWRDLVPAARPIGVCAHCGRRDEPGKPLVAYGTTEGGATDLHSQCWPAWNADRIRLGTAFLNSLGITAAAPQEGDRAFRQR